MFIFFFYILKIFFVAFFSFFFVFLLHVMHKLSACYVSKLLCGNCCCQIICSQLLLMLTGAHTRIHLRDSCANISILIIPYIICDLMSLQRQALALFWICVCIYMCRYVFVTMPCFMLSAIKMLQQQ